MRIACNENGIVSVTFTETQTNDAPPGEAFLLRARGFLDAYFAGGNPRMDLPLAPKGTPFQIAVWKTLLTIPYGETRSYQWVAKTLGRDKHFCQAVGQAIGANPIIIFIPCHRIIAKDGSLGGYAYGAKSKEALLRLEKKAWKKAPADR